MKYLIDALGEIEDRLKQRYIYLFLDYDGTLAPITSRPQDAVLPASTKEVLSSLVHTDRISLAIVSGRAVSDIKKMVGVDGIIYVGNHGLEVDGSGVSFENDIPKESLPLLRDIKSALWDGLHDIEGVAIEDKGLSLSVHYRLVDPARVDAVKRILDKVMVDCSGNKYFTVHGGKMVHEIRPVSQFDKGQVVMWLLSRETLSLDKEVLPIYIGDDITDEDAFASVKTNGIAIRVGQRDDSQAEYYVNDTGEVEDFLFHILRIR